MRRNPSTQPTQTIYAITHIGSYHGPVLIGYATNKQSIFDICEDYKYFGEYLNSWNPDKHAEMDRLLQDDTVEEFKIELFEADFRQSTPDIFLVNKISLDKLITEEYMFLKTK